MFEKPEPLEEAELTAAAPIQLIPNPDGGQLLKVCAWCLPGSSSATADGEPVKITHSICRDHRQELTH
jgi:hypothetical protein